MRHIQTHTDMYKEKIKQNGKTGPHGKTGL